jgi:hypothetical protein
MKRTLLIGAFLAMACISACIIAPAREVMAFAYRVYRRSKDWLVDGLTGALKLAGGDPLESPRHVELLVQAKAFVMRQAKRERPELTGAWRMCPST